jgi:hypothetical protein
VRRPLAVALSLSLLVPAAAAPSTILAACDPATAPVYDPAVRPPTAIDGVGFDFGAEQMTVEDIGLVLDAIDADSDRVVTASAATRSTACPSTTRSSAGPIG